MFNHYRKLYERVESGILASDGLVRDALKISLNLEIHISPVKVIKLLEQAFGEQGLDALIVSREQYYREAAKKSAEYRKEYSTEIHPYLDTYVRKMRIRAVFLFAAGFLSVLNMIAWWAAYLDLVPLAVLYDKHIPESAKYNGASHVLFTFTNEHVMLVILGIAVAVAVFASLLRKFALYGIRRVDRSIEPAAEGLYRRLVSGFRSVVINLMRTARELQYDPLLRSDRAPTLVEVESGRVFPSDTYDRIVDFLQLHLTSAIGVAGQRGAGKSTLLRWLVYNLQPEWITVYLPTPATYDSLDFARTIFRSTVNAVLSSYQSKTISFISRVLSKVKRSFRPSSSKDQIIRISNEMLNLVTSSRTDQWTLAGGFSAKGASLQQQKQTTISQKELTHPELIAAFTSYLERYRRLGGRKIVIAIDELDKLATAEDAISAVNGLKDLFHLPNTHFIISVSEDALTRFVMRGIPFRDVFDSSFDDIVQVDPPSPEDAWKLLTYRVGGFPISVALFCYAWSGGVPRDLIRTARACVDIRRRLHRPVTIRELASPVIRKDLKDALDAALTTILMEKNTLGVESVLVLRRNMEDESSSLEKVLRDMQSSNGVGSNSDESDRSLLLRRLALYISLGHAIESYFNSNFDEIVTTSFPEVTETVRKFARAKLALSSYPSEAEWILSEALKTVKSDNGKLNAQRRRPSTGDGG